MLVLVVCIIGLVLHYQIMLRRGKLDDLLRLSDETQTTDERALGYAIAEYNSYIKRFPGVIMAKILGFSPHE